MLRDRDAATAWNAASDGTMEERVYYAQNFRHDVSALITSDGRMIEWIKYSSYGVPWSLPAGDTDSDGDFDATDASAITGTYDVRKDVNLEGTVDIDDFLDAFDLNNGYVNQGWSKLGLTKWNNRKGYAGYEGDTALAGTKWHVRHRVLESELGKWMKRDPLQGDGGINDYAYTRSQPIRFIDATGLITIACDDMPVSLNGNTTKWDAWVMSPSGYIDSDVPRTIARPFTFSGNLNGHDYHYKGRAWGLGTQTIRHTGVELTVGWSVRSWTEGIWGTNSYDSIDTGAESAYATVACARDGVPLVDIDNDSPTTIHTVRGVTLTISKTLSNSTPYGTPVRYVDVFSDVTVSVAGISTYSGAPTTMTLFSFGDKVTYRCVCCAWWIEFTHYKFLIENCRGSRFKLTPAPEL